MVLIIDTETRGRVRVSPSPGDTIFDIKAFFQEEMGIPVHQQRVMLPLAGRYKPVELDDHEDAFSLNDLQDWQPAPLLLRTRVPADEPVASAHPKLRLPPQFFHRVVAPGDLVSTHVPSQTFRDGRSVHDTTKELQRNRNLVLPPMKIVEFVGQRWCRSTRRLLAYKSAGRQELVEGIHWNMYGVDKHFIRGLSLEALLMTQTVIRLSSMQVETDIMAELVAATEVERRRECRRSERF